MTIHAFFTDDLFKDRSSPYQSAISNGPVGALHPRVLSYFVQPIALRDERASRELGSVLDPIQVASPTRAELLVDAEFHQSELDAFHTWPEASRQVMFTILDRLLLRYNTNESVASVEQELLQYPDAIYKQGTLVYSTTSTMGVVYQADGTSTVQVRVPDFVVFSVIVGSATYDFKVWAAKATFLEKYPNSKIMAVVPPLPPTDLLEKSLIVADQNMFLTADKSSAVGLDALDDVIAQEDSSGYTSYEAKFVDPENNYVFVRFNLAYKGHVPGKLACRAAIKAYLLGSGVGTYAQWKARVPELFIEAQFFMIPMWNNKTVRPDQVIYPSTIPSKKIKAAAVAVLFDLDQDFVMDNLDVVSAAYETLTIAAVPNTLNAVNRLSFSDEHPTYQNYAPHEAGFAYMTQITQQFSRVFNSALVVAAGAAVDPALVPINLDGRVFYTFTVNSVEYYVINAETFTNIIEAGQL